MLAYDWMWWGQLTNQNLAWRCAEVFQRGGGGKNQDFMLIRFLNAGIWLDVLGAISQSESYTEVRGGAQRCTEGCAEVCRGVRGGAQRGVWRGVCRCVEGCTEVHGGARRCMEGCVEVCRGVSLQLIRLCGEVSLQLFRLCGGVSLQLFKLCGGVSLQLGCVDWCHFN